jgi:hypothetical protein
VNGEIEVFDNNVLKLSEPASGSFTLRLVGAAVNAGSQTIFDIDQTALRTTIECETVRDQVNVGEDATSAGNLNVSAASLRGIDGPVFIGGFEGMGQVTLDDRGDSSKVTTKISGSSMITGVPVPGDDAYLTDGWASISYSGINALYVYGSQGARGQYKRTPASMSSSHRNRARPDPTPSTSRQTPHIGFSSISIRREGSCPWDQTGPVGGCTSAT